MPSQQLLLVASEWGLSAGKYPDFRSWMSVAKNNYWEKTMTDIID